MKHRQYIYASMYQVCTRYVDVPADLKLEFIMINQFSLWIVNLVQYFLLAGNWILTYKIDVRITFSVICSGTDSRLRMWVRKIVRNPQGHGSCIMEIEPLLINKHLMSFNIIEYPADRGLSAVNSELYAMNSPWI